MTLGVRVKELRLSRGYTQAVLAEKSGVSVAEVCRIENGGRKNPSMHLLVGLLQALEVTEKEFIDITGFNKEKKGA